MKIERNKGYRYEKDGVKITLTDSPETVKLIAKRKKTKKVVGWSVFGVLMFVLVFNLFLLPLTAPYGRVDGMDSYDGNNAYIVFDETPLISAHRAGGDLAPEETLMAFELCMNATDYKVDIVEFDLHITADGQLVLLHDDTVDRTSNAREHFGYKNVEVKDKTLAELKQLNFGENFRTLDGEYPYRGLRGEEIPDNVRILTLDEILTYLKSMRGDDLNYIIEIKNGGKDGERAMDILYTKMVEYDIVENTIVGTFQNNVTKYIDKHYPSLTRSASILEVLDFYYAFLYGTKPNVKCNVLQVPKGLAMFNLGTKAFIDYAHHYDIAVQYWTINDPDDVRELIENGADAIITDNPEVAYGVLHS